MAGRRAAGKIPLVRWLGRHERPVRRANNSLDLQKEPVTHRPSGYLRFRLAMFPIALAGVLVFAFLPLSPVTVPAIGTMLLIPTLLLRRDERSQLVASEVRPPQIPTTLP